jgi:hypothetical protein
MRIYKNSFINAVLSLKKYYSIEAEKQLERELEQKRLEIKQENLLKETLRLKLEETLGHANLHK